MSRACVVGVREKAFLIGGQEWVEEMNEVNRWTNANLEIWMARAV